MLKLILGIIAFIFTFSSSVSLVGLLFGFPKAPDTGRIFQLRNNSATKYKIRSLLDRDDRFGRQRDRKIFRLYKSGESEKSAYFRPEYRAAVNDYAYDSSNMSDAGLPRDFQYAWRQHMEAWKKQAANLNTFQEKNLKSGESLIENYSDNTDEINETWRQVLRIARRYGVKKHYPY